MWKWMVEFLSKFQGRGIKIARVNSIHFAKHRFSGRADADAH